MSSLRDLDTHFAVFRILSSLRDWFCGKIHIGFIASIIYQFAKVGFIPSTRLRASFHRFDELNASLVLIKSPHEFDSIRLLRPKLGLLLQHQREDSFEHQHRDPAAQSDRAHRSVGMRQVHVFALSQSDERHYRRHARGWEDFPQR